MGLQFPLKCVTHVCLGGGGVRILRWSRGYADHPAGAGSLDGEVAQWFPNLFGTRDQCCGRQFFNEPGSRGMVWG